MADFYHKCPGKDNLEPAPVFFDPHLNEEGKPYFCTRCLERFANPHDREVIKVRALSKGDFLQWAHLQYNSYLVDLNPNRGPWKMPVHPIFNPDPQASKDVEGFAVYLKTRLQERLPKRQLSFDINLSEIYDMVDETLCEYLNK